MKKRKKFNLSAVRTQKVAVFIPEILPTHMARILFGSDSLLLWKPGLQTHRYLSPSTTQRLSGPQTAVSALHGLSTEREKKDSKIQVIR